MTTQSQHPETIGIHGGSYRTDPATNAVAVPIYQTTSYQFNDADHAANLDAGHLYCRAWVDSVCIAKDGIDARSVTAARGRTTGQQQTAKEDGGADNNSA